MLQGVELSLESVKLTAFFLFISLSLHHCLELLELLSLLLKLLLLFEVQLPLQGDHVTLNLIILGPVVISMLIRYLKSAFEFDDLELLGA